MASEHDRFLKSGYTEERWQQVLESRRQYRLKQSAMRDWAYEQNQEFYRQLENNPPQTLPPVILVRPQSVATKRQVVATTSKTKMLRNVEL